ncbi:uncharacterized protein LOC103790460 [Callithrix jacchus]
MLSKGADKQRRSVPFQLLLLQEKMEDSRQNAVQPLELAYCLQKYSILPGGQYELFTVIAHVGMVDSSHYCAYIWNAVDKKWFFFNDSNIA